MLPPFTEAHLPTLGPLPTVAPTTTTTTPLPTTSTPAATVVVPLSGGAPAGPPLGPPANCRNNGTYTPTSHYTFVGTGVCLGHGGARIPFKKQRMLTRLNVECTCREACDQEPGCIGFSVRMLADQFGFSCRVYGASLSTLVDRWVDLGSLANPRYSGREVSAADGTNDNECFVKDRAVSSGAPSPAAPALISLESGVLAWERWALQQCRQKEAKQLALLDQGGCRAGLLRRSRVVPAECICDCPICNWWQQPPPMCEMPDTGPGVAPAPAEPHPGAGLPTEAPRPATPPPVPPRPPRPALPPIGEQFLPTLAPVG